MHTMFCRVSYCTDKNRNMLSEVDQVFKNMGPIILLTLAAHHTSNVTSRNGTSWMNT